MHKEHTVTENRDTSLERMRASFTGDREPEARFASAVVSYEGTPSVQRFLLSFASLPPVHARVEKSEDRSPHDVQS